MYFQLKINSNFYNIVYYGEEDRFINIKPTFLEIYNRVNDGSYKSNVSKFMIDRLPDLIIKPAIPEINTIDDLYLDLFKLVCINDSYNTTILRAYSSNFLGYRRYVVLTHELQLYLPNTRLSFNIDNFCYYDLIFLLTEEISNNINIAKELDIFSLEPVLSQEEIDLITSNYIYQESDSNITRKRNMLKTINKYTKDNKLKDLTSQILTYYKQVYEN